jgi:serine protease Do
VHLTLLRQGKPLELDATVGHLDETKVASAESGDEDQQGDGSALGMTLSSLNPTMRSRLHLGHDVTGAIITHVDSGSAADDIGLEGGDVIERIDGQAIHGPDDAKALFATAEKTPAKPILLLVDRHGAKSFIALPQKPDAG